MVKWSGPGVAQERAKLVFLLMPLCQTLAPVFGLGGLARAEICFDSTCPASAACLDFYSP